ncbi:hypothetical protein MUK42_12819 [Musa troglodytarum]|uniref:Uncharacterized protein n=1 Tax=Musa troglodytarum TaxID=320322 RepID=A0A9E7H975_9LILI|nr:hypothetical protein MUK42_12819 [Musa troglodytarum]
MAMAMADGRAVGDARVAMTCDASVATTSVASAMAIKRCRLSECDRTVVGAPRCAVILMQCSGARPIRPPPSLSSLRVICSSSDLEGWLSWFPPRMSRAPPSDADKGSPFRNYELKEESLLKLVDCEKRCRELQAQLSSLEREVPLLEDRLEKRRVRVLFPFLCQNEARLSDVALQKCIIAWNDLEMEENFWVATYGKSSKTWNKVDDDVR